MREDFSEGKAFLAKWAGDYETAFDQFLLGYELNCLESIVNSWIYLKELDDLIWLMTDEDRKEMSVLRLTDFAMKERKLETDFRTILKARKKPETQFGEYLKQRYRQYNKKTEFADLSAKYSDVFDDRYVQVTLIHDQVRIRSYDRKMRPVDVAKINRLAREINFFHPICESSWKKAEGFQDFFDESYQEADTDIVEIVPKKSMIPAFETKNLICLIYPNGAIEAVGKGISIENAKEELHAIMRLVSRASSRT